MNDLAEASKAYISARTTQGLNLDQQLMLTYAAGAVYGVCRFEDHLKVKYTMDKAKKVAP